MSWYINHYLAYMQYPNCSLIFFVIVLPRPWVPAYIKHAYYPNYNITSC